MMRHRISKLRLMGLLLFPTGFMFVIWLYSCHFAISILSFSQFYRAVQDIVNLAV